MIKNYLKISFRNLIRSPFYSITTSVGLSVGITCVVLTVLFIHHEFSFDTFHRNYENIYRVEADLMVEDGHSQYQAVIPFMPGKYFKNYDEVKHSVRFLKTNLLTYIEFEDSDKAWHGIFSEPELFDIFSFPFVKGDKDSCFPTDTSIVITESFARFAFGEENVIGRTLRTKGNKEYVVSGVLKDIPANSHFSFHYVLPLKLIMQSNFGQRLNMWGASAFYTYIELKNQTSYKHFEKKISTMIADSSEMKNKKLYLKPLKKIHLHSHIVGEFSNNGSIENILIFSIIALIVLALAVINYTNLTIANAFSRLKEISVRKIVGATRQALIYQFLFESIILSLIGTLIAYLLVDISLPVFNELTERHISIAVFSWYAQIAAILAIALVIGLLSGAYPSIVLTRINISVLLSRAVRWFNLDTFFRRLVLIIQFSASLVLIIISSFLFSQVKFMENKDIGFDIEKLFLVSDIAPFTQEKYQWLCQRFQESEKIENFTYVLGYPIYATPTFSENVKDYNEKILFSYNLTDTAFINTYGLKVVKYLYTDTLARSHLYINETGYRLLRSKVKTDSLAIVYQDDTIIPFYAVLDDFHFKSLNNKITPLLIFSNPDNFNTGNCFIVRAKTKTQKDWQRIKAAYRKQFQDSELNFSGFDKDYKKYYIKERKLSKTFTYFSVLAILIATTGLMGLVLFINKQRVKEIGIRKVLGAHPYQVIRFLSAEFMKLIVIAMIIAIPVAYFFVERMLSSFAYRIPVTIDIFLISGALLIFLSQISLALQTLQIARLKPVDALRDE